MKNELKVAPFLVKAEGAPDCFYMPDTFEECIPIILEAEGGYVNDPADPGGETKFGISKRAFPKINIADLTIQQAKAIYKEYYWDRARIERLPSHLRLVVFDACVNMGNVAAIRLLQRLAEVAEDGVVGRVTAARATQITFQRYLQARRDFYQGIVARRPASRKFLRGWLLRIGKLARIIKKALAGPHESA